MPALAITPVLEDEPGRELVPVAEPAKRTSTGLDLRAINRKAVANWKIVRSYLVDMHGKSLIQSVNPSWVAPDPNRGRPYGTPDPTPRLVMFRGPMPHDADPGLGSWYDVGSGRAGKDLIKLVQYLSGADRRTSALYLRDLCNRIVEIAA